MNRTYSLVWNRALRVLQVASELARCHGGAAPGDGANNRGAVNKVLTLAIVAALAVGLAPVALATPPPSPPSSDSGCTGVDAVCGTNGGNASGQTGGASSISGPDANAGGQGGNDGGGVGSSGQGVAGSGGDGGHFGGVAGGSGAGGGGTGGGARYAAGGGGGGGLHDWGNGGGGGGGYGGSYHAGGGGGGGGPGNVFAADATTTGNILGGAGGNGSAGSTTQGGTGTGGGGGGGAGVLVQGGVSLANASGFTVRGGNGGQGGDGSSTAFGQYGGGGGGGGAGLLLPGSRPSDQLANFGSVAGGKGGGGGNGVGGRNGGRGGDGGTGVYGSGFELVNTGDITGGNGGAGGGGQTPGVAGAGGVGVVATGGASITDTGSISGGMSGNGKTQADAVDFSGGDNTLTLESGYSFTGNVISTSGVGSSAVNGGDTLALGGSGNGTFNLAQIVATQPTDWNGKTQLFGFNHFEKTGSSTWTMTGKSGVAGFDGFNINDGSLNLDKGVKVTAIQLDLKPVATLKIDSTLTVSKTLTTEKSSDGAGTLVLGPDGQLYAKAISNAGNIIVTGCSPALGEPSCPTSVTTGSLHNSGKIDIESESCTYHLVTCGFVTLQDVETAYNSGSITDKIVDTITFIGQLIPNLSPGDVAELADPPNGSPGNTSAGADFNNLAGGTVALQAANDFLATTGNYNNDAGSSLALSGGDERVIAGAGFINSGTVKLFGAGDAIITPSFANTGKVSIGTGEAIGIKTLKLATAVGTVNATSYSQTAGSTNVNGTLYAPAVNISGGTLSGTGLIASLPDALGGSPNPTVLTVTGDGTLIPGKLDAPGTLTVDGALEVLGNLETGIHGTSDGQFGVLDVMGPATFGTDSVFKFMFNSFHPAAGDTFQFLDASSFLNFNDVLDSFSSSSDCLGLVSSLTCMLSMNGAGNGLLLTLSKSSTVPEPGSLGMLGFGLVLLGSGVGWRKWRDSKEEA